MILIIILGFLPVPSEIIFDKWRWRSKKDDKPLSTWLRAVLFLVIIVVCAVTGLAEWWRMGIFLVINMTAFFDNLLNINRNPKKPFFYHPNKGWYARVWIFINGIHPAVEVMVKVLLYAIGILIMLDQ